MKKTIAALVTDSIHGHAVLEMITASGTAYTRDLLLEEINGRFGSEARFHTCAAENMTATELLEFLESRGKFRPLGDGFTTDESNVCKG